VFVVPFSWRLWIAVVVAVFILTVSLTTIHHLRLYCQHVKKEDLSIMTSAMLIAAIFLQQGTGVFFNSAHVYPEQFIRVTTITSSKLGGNPYALSLNTNSIAIL